MAQIVSSYEGAQPNATRVRQDIVTLQAEYEKGNRKPLSDLLRAWKYIQTTKYSDYFSFFTIAGYHGEPFRGAGWGNPQWWGGYCNHGNVLFPTWHRAYLYRLENALRRAPGCENVTLPYWNEIAKTPVDQTVPWVFLVPSIKLDDGTLMDPNPLHSYTFQQQVSDNLAPPEIIDTSTNKKSDSQILNPIYNKAKSYTTCRFPFSGFSDPNSTTYNTKLKEKTPAQIDLILNECVHEWINKKPDVRSKYVNCLKAPTYTVFSNTTSMAQWNEDHPEELVTALESPHNDIHLAVGGYNVSSNQDVNPEKYKWANGDMGENNTASFDPIFFFHHCFVDKTFWDWQVGHKNSDGSSCEDKLEVEAIYPGTNSVDAQGPTPGIAGGTWLDLNTPLEPFKHGDTPSGKTMMSQDVINIRRQLGYDYGESFHAPLAMEPPPPPAKLHAHVSGINRGNIAGSFIVATFKEDIHTKEKTLIGQESVLSRWATSGCANCQNHLQVKAHVPLHGVEDKDIIGPTKKYNIYAKVRTRQFIKGNDQDIQPAVALVPVNRD